MSGKYEFETKEGKVFEFDSEKEFKDFSVRYTIGNLVADGYGEITVIDGEEVFRINERGRAHLAQHEASMVSKPN